MENFLKETLKDLTSKNESFFLEGVFVVNDAPEGRYGYRKVDVVIADGKIASVAESGSAAAPAGATVIPGRDRLLLPGFHNGHTHSSEVFSRGSIDLLPLEGWLCSLIDETGGLTRDDIFFGALLTGFETLMSGGTSVLDHLSPLVDGDGHKHVYDAVAAAAAAYRALGIRATIAPLVGDYFFDVTFPAVEGEAREYEPRQTDDILLQLRRCVDDFHRPEEGIAIAMGPTGIQLCSDALLRGCVALSEERGLARHIHCLETKAQRELALQKYGKSAVAHLRDLGFLGPRTSCAHCVHLDENDAVMFAQTGTTVVHNALSNLRLGSGLAPVTRYRQLGVNVAFGCDGAASNDGQDMLESIKIGMFLHNSGDMEYRHWIRPREAARMASLGGYTGIGLQDRCGTIEPGKDADVVLYDLTRLSQMPRTDPLGLLLMGRPHDVVESAWVAGRRVVQNKEPVGVAQEALRQVLYERTQWKLEPMPTPLWDEIEPKYRESMKDFIDGKKK